MFEKGALATKFEDRKVYYDKYQEIVYLLTLNKFHYVVFLLIKHSYLFLHL